jgi:hypothetical protein
MQCRCGAPLWALGIPDCYPVLRPIVRAAFETVLESSSDPDDFNLLTSTRYPNARRLMSPTLYNVESERPEPVFEELSGTKFFVRPQPRSFKALFPKPPTEWGINIEQLRCVSRLGVFLIDSEGVVWGRRVSVDSAAPILVEPGTVQVRLLFPSDATITKYEFSFDFAQSLMDFELVPVYVNKALTNYAPLIAARILPSWSAPTLRVFVFALYARGAGDFNIPIPDLTTYLEVVNNAGTVITTNFTEVAPGVYEDSTASLSASGNPYTVRVRSSFPPPPGVGVFDYTTAVAQFNV